MEKIIYNYEEYPPLPFDGKYRLLDVKTIKKLTRMVRDTIEYRQLMKYMKKNLDINKCSFYSDYTIEKGLTIELHHHPFTLFDFVDTVARKQFNSKEVEKDRHIIPYKVINEVLNLHYFFYVGLVPLNPTCHELVHAGKLVLHPSMIIGDYKYFVEEYKPFLSEEVLDKLDEFEVVGTKDIEEIPEILKYRPAMVSNLNIRSLESYDIERIIVEKATQRFIENNKNP